MAPVQNLMFYTHSVNIHFILDVLRYMMNLPYFSISQFLFLECVLLSKFTIFPARSSCPGGIFVSTNLFFLFVFCRHPWFFSTWLWDDNASRFSWADITVITPLKLFNNYFQRPKWWINKEDVESVCLDRGFLPIGLTFLILVSF